jgi:hypothetical protein
VVEIRNKLGNLSKQHSSSSRNAQVMNLTTQYKNSKERLDKYGCRDEILELVIEVCSKDKNYYEDYTISFVGILEKTQEQWIELIKYRLLLEYNGMFEFSQIKSYRQYRPGFLSLLK